MGPEGMLDRYVCSIQTIESLVLSLLYMLASGSKHLLCLFQSSSFLEDVNDSPVLPRKCSRFIDFEICDVI